MSGPGDIDGTVRGLPDDPASPQITDRGTDETIGPDIMAARITNAPTFYHPLPKALTTEPRLHRMILYNSIYRADDQLFVSTHAYATPAVDTPSSTPTAMVAWGLYDRMRLRTEFPVPRQPMAVISW